MKKIIEINETDGRGNGIQVIARASSILEALSDEPFGMSLGQIAKAVNLPRSTVQRIVHALGIANLVRADGANGVRLGPAILRLVAKLHADVIGLTSDLLQTLSDEVAETVVLCNMSGNQLSVVHVIVAEHELRVTPRVGSVVSPHHNAGGKALLALKSDADVAALLSAGVAADHINLPALLTELDQVRDTGFASDDGEMQDGLSTYAIALETVLGPYSVSVAAPTARSLKKHALILAQLSLCRQALEHQIGTVWRAEPAIAKDTESKKAAV